MQQRTRDAGAGRDQAERGGGAADNQREMQEQAERGGGVQQRTRDAGAGRDQAERGGGCSREPEMQEQVGTRLRGGGGGCSR